MYKQKQNMLIVNTRDIPTRMHDAVLFTTVKPNSEKYKNRHYYSTAHYVYFPTLANKLFFFQNET